MKTDKNLLFRTFNSLAIGICLFTTPIAFDVQKIVPLSPLLYFYNCLLATTLVVAIFYQLASDSGKCQYKPVRLLKILFFTVCLTGIIVCWKYQSYIPEILNAFFSRNYTQTNRQ